MKLILGEVRTRQIGNLVATMRRDRHFMSPVSTNTSLEPEIHSMQQVVHRRQRQVVPPDAMKNVVDLIMEE